MTSAEEILSKLNDEQQLPVINYNGPSFIVAGPGAGKTHTIISRTQYMIVQGIKPENILLFTFTNKAAKEIKERIIKVIGEDAGNKITSGTYHSFCCRLLRKYCEKLGFKKGFTIFDSEDSEKVIKKICKGTNADPNRLKSYVSEKKRNLITPQDASLNREDKLANFYDAYQKELFKQNAMDFDDLIFNTIKLLRNNPDVLLKVNAQYQYITADEFHDSAKSDIHLIKLLAGMRQNVCFILDNDQSIYSFRGADLDAVLDTRYMFKDLKVYTLNNNYRCSKTIVEASKSLIAHNPVVIKKNITTENKDGMKLLVFEEKTEAEEALRVVKSIQSLTKQKYVYKDIAILYRTNRQSRSIEDVLLKYRIPYEILSGINFYSREEIKDVMAFLKFIVNPYDSVSFERIINIPKRGLGEGSVAKIIDESRSHFPPIDLLEACNQVKGLRNPGKNNVLLFYKEIKRLKDIKDELPVSQFIAEVVKTFNYYSHIEDKYKGDEEAIEDKIENVIELIKLGSEYMSLEEMLEQTSLDRTVETDESKGCVKLMTMHMSKGLEFPIVFLIGCNEGTSPHFNSVGTVKGVEEERRLFYVGMTRAKEILILTRGKSSPQPQGGWVKNRRSRFLTEINPKYIHPSCLFK